MCDEGTVLILKSLQNLTTLLILDLSYNHISSKSCDDIATIIDSNRLLEQLWLDGNQLLSIGISKLTKTLKNHFKLRLLSLFSNGITNNAGKDISVIITSNTCLEDLMLGRNPIQSSGFCKFSKELFDLKIYENLT